MNDIVKTLDLLPSQSHKARSVKNFPQVNKPLYIASCYACGLQRHVDNELCPEAALFVIIAILATPLLDVISALIAVIHIFFQQKCVRLPLIILINTLPNRLIDVHVKFKAPISNTLPVPTRILLNLNSVPSN